MNLRSSSEGELKTVFFVSFCIETVTNRLKCSASDVYFCLQRVGLIEEYLGKCYDTFHTKSKECVLDDVLEALNNCEKVIVTDNNDA